MAVASNRPPTSLRPDMRNLVAEIPPAVVAQLLSYSDNCTQHHAQLAGQPWSRYVT
jgi:hypothetical protein